jgi:Domain of unknown function (DUF4440)
MKIKYLVSAFAFFLGFNTIVLSQNKEEKYVAEAVETLRLTMVDPSEATFKKLLSDDLSYGHSGGHVDTKMEFVEAFKTGKSDFIKIDLSDQTIKIVGKTAIVRHKLIGETKDAGKEQTTVKLLVMTVWIKQKSGWQLLARQAVKTT